MSKPSIEIPFSKDRSKKYRFFEILPGVLSWGILALPFILSIYSPLLALIFIIGYILLWFFKAMVLNIRSIQGYRRLQSQQKLPWNAMLEDLKTGKLGAKTKDTPEWHAENVTRVTDNPTPITTDNIVHALIVAIYNEGREVVEPTIQSVLDSDYDMKNVILVLAYEQRGGPEVGTMCNDLIKQYGQKFKHAMAVEHPDNIEGEVTGKGGNITYAGRELTKYITSQKIDPLHVIVTTLDSDNHPHKQYLPALSYLYNVTPEPRYVSYQPIPIYTKNIWDVPAPIRVIATGNSFWNIVLSMRPHMIRNFASHAQSLATLIDTDYWSVRTVVEDGHQFWRTYFTYDGKHDVYPLYVPVYQDSVLSDNYRKTLLAQFKQLQRWSYGVSDVAYVAKNAFFSGRKLPKFDAIAKFSRLLEGHVTWAVAPLLLAFSGFIPRLVNPSDLGAVGFSYEQLPRIISRIQTIALIGIVVTLFLSMRMLPPKPARYKHHRTFFMIIQWVMLPLTTVVYNSLSALNSQTKLMFGKYMEHFVVTDKKVKSD